MNWLKAFQRNFHFWNFISLSVIGFFLRVYDTGSTPIEWPISSLLSIYILSSLLFHLKAFLKQWQKIIPISILFISLHWVLAGLIEIILTRFLRYPEMYAFDDFSAFLTDHFSLLIDGGSWFVVYSFLFWAMAVATQMDSMNRSIQELEKKLHQSDLSKLGKEINPHFLFNAMNGIAMKVRLNENTTAVSMIAALNDLLRLSLKGQSNELITLSEELALLEKYLMIEQTRFGEHISWSTDIPETLKNLKVPRLILQPLAENAFKHGMNQGSNHMELSIAAEEHADSLSIRVYNSQQFHAKINYATSNVGLPNVVHRLKQFYQTDFQFKSFIENDGVAFQITIPKKS